MWSPTASPSYDPAMGYEKKVENKFQKRRSEQAVRLNIASMGLVALLAATVLVDARWMNVLCFIAAIPLSAMAGISLVLMLTYGKPDVFKQSLSELEHDLGTQDRLPGAYYMALFEAYSLHNRLARLTEFLLREGRAGHVEFDREWVNELFESCMTMEQFHTQLSKALPHGLDPHVVQQRSGYVTSGDVAIAPVPKLLTATETLPTSASSSEKPA